MVGRAVVSSADCDAAPLRTQMPLPFTRVLSTGAQGDDVTIMQNLLYRAPIAKYQPTGFFG